MQYGLKIQIKPRPEIKSPKNIMKLMVLDRKQQPYWELAQNTININWEINAKKNACPKHHEKIYLFAHHIDIQNGISSLFQTRRTYRQSSSFDANLQKLRIIMDFRDCKDDVVGVSFY